MFNSDWINLLISEILPQILEHRIRLITNVIIHLYLLLGLALITYGGYKMRNKVRSTKKTGEEMTHR